MQSIPDFLAYFVAWKFLFLTKIDIYTHTSIGIYCKERRGEEQIYRQTERQIKRQTDI